MDREIKRGDIYLADFDPVRGSEQSGIRPCLILQNNIGNRYAPTVIVAAITSKKEKRNFPTHCSLPDINILVAKSMVLLEQIRSIDKSRLLKYLGSLEETSMEGINCTLALSVGLSESGKGEIKHDNERGQTEC